MPDDPAAAVNSLAIQEMLLLPKLYGPNGLYGPGGPPVAQTAALEQLETATVDPARLTGGMTTDSVAVQTATDLANLANATTDVINIVSSPAHSGIQIEALAFFAGPAFQRDLLMVEADATLFTAGTTPPVIVLPPPPPSGLEQFLVTDITTGRSDWQDGALYTGPVTRLANQYVNISSDKLNLTATRPDNFIHTGSGDDAIDVSLVNGSNVLDGGGGSNFLVGGGGIDTFFVDARAASADVWSTVSHFHPGDTATIWGIALGDFNLVWADGQGSAGATGLTLHATAVGRAVTSLTLAGLTQADMAAGRLSISFGTDSATGSAYMNILANR